MRYLLPALALLVGHAADAADPPDLSPYPRVRVQTNLGNFELDALGVRWVRDLGADNYNLPGYWDKKRGGKETRGHGRAEVRPRRAWA